jgi:hypothetical protein
MQKLSDPIATFYQLTLIFTHNLHVQAYKSYAHISLA